MSLISTLNIFLAICFVPILLLMYIVLHNEGKPKNNLILSTTIPKEAWEDERVIAIRKSFYRELNITCLILVLFYLPVLFTEYVSVQMTYILLWMDAVIVVPNIPYCRNVKKMRNLKKANWYHPELVKIQVADTSLSSVFEEKQNTYTFVNFLLPLLVSLIPLLYPLVVPTEGSLMTLYIVIFSNSSTILVLYFCYRMLRKKADRVNSDVTLSAVLTRIRRYYWGKFWLYAGWFCAIFNFTALLLLFCSEVVFLIVISLFVLVIIGLALGMELKIRTEQQRLNQEQPSEILMDEDDYWPYGIIYYNKNDSNLMVNSRVGLGTTTNSAHPVGLTLDILAVVLLLALPFTGLFTVKEEFTEPQVILTETAIEAHHTGKEYTILLHDIKDLSLLSEMPKASKSWGSNFPHLYKGNFSVKGISGNCKLCLDPYDDTFLLIRTTDEKYYLFSMKDAEELKKLYNELTR